MKHAGLLTISGKSCELTPHYLEKSFRPIVLVEVDVGEMENDAEKIDAEIVMRVEKEMKRKAFGSEKTKLPLVRVKL